MAIIPRNDGYRPQHQTAIARFAKNIPPWNFIGEDASHPVALVALNEKSFVIGKNMKNIKILPASAGVIALTAVACFAPDKREDKEADNSRTRVMVHSLLGQKTAENMAQAQERSQRGHAYHVEVERGSRINEVMIDAHTGKILGKREITASNA